MTNKSPEELAHIVLAVVIGSSVELSQAMINMVNLYLDSPQRGHIESAGENVDILAAFGREAMRMLFRLLSHEIVFTQYLHRNRPSVCWGLQYVVISTVVVNGLNNHWI